MSKKGRYKVTGEDRISSLPDEVIVSILSRLHLKEAGKSSVVSKRWRDLWTYLTDLDFDDYKTLYFLPHVHDRLIKVKKYVNWVRRVLLLFAGRTLHINSLRIHFALDNTFSSYVNNWFDFAMSSKLVKHLYLNLGTCFGLTIGNPCYLQPISLVSINENLQSLTLVSVDISDQFIDSILAQCPNLERLSLSYCNRFTRLKLLPSSSCNNKLKHLYMQYCFHAYDVEIYAPNLTCFTYIGKPSHSVNFLHAPNLTEVAFGGGYSLHLLENLHGSYYKYRIECLDSFLSLSSQLHKVSLVLFKQVRYNSTVLGAAFRNLKQLELIVAYDYNCALLTTFIEACPLLQAFKLKFTLVHIWPKHVGGGMNRAEVVKLKQVHEKLKAIEYVGEFGSESSVKLALCLTQQALFLDTFLFDCCLLDPIGERQLIYHDWAPQRLLLSSGAARSLAQKIQDMKPIHIVIKHHEFDV